MVQYACTAPRVLYIQCCNSTVYNVPSRTFGIPQPRTRADSLSAVVNATRASTIAPAWPGGASGLVWDGNHGMETDRGIGSSSPFQPHEGCCVLQGHRLKRSFAAHSAQAGELILIISAAEWWRGFFVAVSVMWQVWSPGPWLPSCHGRMETSFRDMVRLTD